MAEEDTRRLLRTFGVTVTNFEERTAQLLEQAKQFRQAGDSDGMLTLLRISRANFSIFKGAGWRSPITSCRNSGRS